MSDWARRASVKALGAVVGFAVLAFAPAVYAAEAADTSASVSMPDSARDLEGLTIARIDIRAREIFDPRPESRLSLFYRAANLLHVKTRDRTIREQLLFARGEGWNQTRADETARTLRQLDYLEPLRMEAHREGDSVAVAVETRDSWTTQPELNLERAGGVQYGSVGLTERNLFGLGKALSFLYHEDAVGISRSLSFRDPAVWGTRLQLAYGAATGTTGSSDLVSISQPFFAQHARNAFGVSWRRSSSVANLFQSGSEVAELDVRDHQTELWAGRGWTRDDVILRALGSVLVLERDLGPTRLEPGSPPDLAGGDEILWQRRIGAEASVWQPRFIVRRDVNRIGREEDFDVGRSIGMKVGYAPRSFGSTANEGFVRLWTDLGAETGLGFGYARGTFSTRLRRGPLEVIRSLDARWMCDWRPGRVLVLSAYGLAGSDVPRNFQVVVGGLNGLRAYPVQALAGREMVRLNAEQRWVLTRKSMDLVSIGTAAFYDAARAWGPGAVGTTWFNAAGMGLRFASPRGAIGPVIRADVAWPLSPTRDGDREAVFTVGSSQAF